MDTSFFNKQLECWDMARNNYRALKYVKRRMFFFDGFDVEILFNPERRRSTAAKVDKASIEARRCFLCQANRPQCQLSVADGDYELLVNPFPIFSPHYTIAHRCHTPQQFLPAFSDMLRLVRKMQGMALFYNGPRCGASAPDHMHFQACNAECFRVITDYFSLPQSRIPTVLESELLCVKYINDYLRTVVCIETPDANAAMEYVSKAVAVLADDEHVEPMMNVIAYFAGRKYYIWLFPRKAFRPWQFDADEPDALMFSPATVEMAGSFITPNEEHFFKILPADVVDIYAQVSMPDAVERLRVIE